MAIYFLFRAFESRARTKGNGRRNNKRPNGRITATTPLRTRRLCAASLSLCQWPKPQKSQVRTAERGPGSWVTLSIYCVLRRPRRAGPALSLSCFTFRRFVRYAHSLTHIHAVLNIVLYIARTARARVRANCPFPYVMLYIAMHTIEHARQINKHKVGCKNTYERTGSILCYANILELIQIALYI